MSSYRKCSAIIFSLIASLFSPEKTQAQTYFAGYAAGSPYDRIAQASLPPGFTISNTSGEHGRVALEAAINASDPSLVLINGAIKRDWETAKPLSGSSSLHRIAVIAQGPYYLVAKPGISLANIRSALRSGDDISIGVSDPDGADCGAALKAASSSPNRVIVHVYRGFAPIIQDLLGKVSKISIACLNSYSGLLHLRNGGGTHLATSYRTVGPLGASSPTFDELGIRQPPKRTLEIVGNTAAVAQIDQLRKHFGSLQTRGNIATELANIGMEFAGSK